jgi:hypothetical protein
LKDLAEHYGVSYPTLRSRLDRVIEHLREAAAGRPADPMARLLGDLVERGELNARAARSILQLHRRKDGGETGHG